MPSFSAALRGVSSWEGVMKGRDASRQSFTLPAAELEPIRESSQDS